MALLRPAYRLEIRNAADNAPLTPRAGSPHANAFKVSTLKNDGIWKPYLNAPGGRRGSIDPLNLHVAAGEQTFQLVDARVAGSNLERWWTAFVGDAHGRNQLKGHIARSWESLDGGETWTEYFVGRVFANTAFDPMAAGAMVAIVVKDARIEEYRDVFVGTPHHSITYAEPSPLLPVGLQDRGDGSGWRSFRKVPRVRGVCYGGGGDYAPAISVNSGQQWPLQEQRRLRLIQELVTSADVRDESGKLARAIGYTVCPHVMVRMRALDGPDAGQEGDFYLAPTKKTSQVRQECDPYDGESISPVWFNRSSGKVMVLGIAELPAGHPRRMDMPVPFTAVEFFVYRAGPPSATAPLLIDDVDPVQLYEDLLLGRFSALDELTGEPAVPLISRDAAAFTALKGTFPAIHLAVDRKHDLAQFLEEKLFRVLQLCMRVDSAGAVRPLDLRQPNVLPMAPELGAGDYESAEWESGHDSITQVLVRYPVPIEAGVRAELLEEGEDPPDVPGCGFRMRRDLVPYLSELAVDLPLRTLEMDADAFPAQANWADPDSKVPPYLAPYERMAREPLQRFGTGAAFLRMRARRSVANAESCWPGERRLIDAPEQPNPATNVRGGIRLMVCVDRQERGPLLELRFLDEGPDSVEVAPVVGNVTLHAGEERSAADLPITLNADDDPVEVELATTTTAVAVRPSADSAWSRAARVTATGTAVIRGLRAGRRVWFRCRSRGYGGLPSPWVYPGNDYVDMGVLPVPTSLVATVSGRSAVLTWTPGDALLATMPLLDGTPVLEEPLPPGSTRFVFDDLPDGASNVGVRHVSTSGATSADVHVPVVTGPARLLASPRRLVVLQGSGAAVAASVPDPRDARGYGLRVSVGPEELHADVRFQASTDPAFATTLVDELYPAGRREVDLLGALSGDRWYVRARHERDGFVSSAWSEVAAAFPTALVANLGADSFPGGSAFLLEDPATGELQVDISSSDPDTAAANWEVRVAEEADGIYPAVDETDDEVLRSEMPFREGVLDGLGAPVKLAGTAAAYLVVRFRNAAGGYGQEVRHEISGTASALPVLERVRQQDAAVETTDLVGTVRDPQGLGVTLRAWVARTSKTSANPDLAPDGEVVFPSTPADFGPATLFGGVKLLDDIQLRPGSGKDVFLEAVNAKGLTSGKQRITLWAGDHFTDDDGNIADDARTTGGQLIQNRRDAFQDLMEAIGQAGVRQALENVRDLFAGVPGSLERALAMPIVNAANTEVLIDTYFQTVAGVQLATSVTDSVGRGVDRALAKDSVGAPDDASSIFYSGGIASLQALKPAEANAEVTAGKDIGVMADRWSSKIQRSSGDPTGLQAIVSRVGNDGNAGSTFADSGGRAVNLMFSKSVDSLGDVPDDATFKKLIGVDGSNRLGNTGMTDGFFAANDAVMTRVFAQNSFSLVSINHIVAADSIVAEKLAVEYLHAIFATGVVASFGDMLAGRMRNPNNTAGIALEPSTAPFGFDPNWLRYLRLDNISGATIALKLGNNFQVTADGTITATAGTFSGALSAATGTFAGSVSGASFTAATATFSGVMNVRAGAGSTKLTLDAQSGAGRISGIDGLTVRAEQGNNLVLETGTGIAGTGDLNLTAIAGHIRFNGSLATGKTALDEYIPIKRPDGTVRHLRLYSP